MEQETQKTEEEDKGSPSGWGGTKGQDPWTMERVCMKFPLEEQETCGKPWHRPYWGSEEGENCLCEGR